MRLSNATLAHLPPAVARPNYDRTQLQNGIVHLGIGAFHRAHQAVCTDDVLRTGDKRWGILAASLRSPTTRDALTPQDNLYTLNTRAESDSCRIIGSVLDILVAPENPTALIHAMASPETRIISLTITEKGYCLDPATGELDQTHPDIQHDLANPHTPRSALGFLAAAITRRRTERLPPFTILSCDNLAANGATLHRVLTAFARHQNPAQAAYIEQEIACPDTMVDRIVPATTEADRNRIAERLGLQDAWPVIAEPFLQWVIEDRFPTGRPDWEAHGATMVTDVAPFEAMKLRLLNASHSALAYMGLLAGHETVAEAIRDPSLAAFTQALMQDAAETLDLPPNTDVAAYQTALLARFANPALCHQLRQIAMDGSQKLPPRLLGTLRDRLARNLPITHHATAIAAWMHYVANTSDLQDPLAPELRRTIRAGGPLALMDLPAIFGTNFPAAARQAIQTALKEG